MSEKKWFDLQAAEGMADGIRYVCGAWRDAKNSPMISEPVRIVLPPDWKSRKEYAWAECLEGGFE